MTYTPHDKSFPLATALRQTLKRGYSRKHFAQDAVAAIIVSLVALPLAMALAIAVGLPPQHGIYTAIVAGMLMPLLGGSMTQVSGPTAAFVVIVAPIVAEHGLRGLILAEIMAGLMLIALAWARLGRFISFVPYPVTTGFTAGIAVVLGTLSLNDLFGLGIAALQGSYLDKLLLIIRHLPDMRWPDAAIGVVSLAIMFFGKSITRKLPSVMLGIVAGTLMGLAFAYFHVDYATIGSRFSFEAGGVTHLGIPPFPPQIHWFGGEGLFAWPGYDELRVLLMPAVVIAALAALESLLSATVADGLSRTRHHPNAELAALGVANIASGLAAGIPATGAIARTTTNIKSGANSPFAAAMHAALIMLYVLALAPLIAYVPMAALSALLLITAYNMSHYKQCWRILRIAPREDIIVFLTCFGLTVFVDMVAGVAVGILLASLLFIQRISAATEVQIEESGVDTDARIPPNVLVYHIVGPLFFATVERALDRTSFLRRRIDTLIVDMQQVPLVDMTGLVAIKNLLAGDALSGKTVIICGKPGILHKIKQKIADAPHLNVHWALSVEEALGSLPKVSAV